MQQYICEIVTIQSHVAESGLHPVNSLDLPKGVSVDLIEIADSGHADSGGDKVVICRCTSSNIDDLKAAATHGGNFLMPETLIDDFGNEYDDDGVLVPVVEDPAPSHPEHEGDSVPHKPEPIPVDPSEP